MTPQTEALKMALEALKDNQHLIADNERHAYVMEYNSIIEKCEKALAQQNPQGVSNEQVNPVAYAASYLFKDDRNVQIFCLKSDAEDWVHGCNDGKVEPLYTHPPVPTAQPKEPEQPKVRTGACLLTGVCASEGHKIQKEQPEQEPVAVGSWDELKIMMGHSAFDGVLQLEDALENIKEFTQAQSKQKQDCEVRYFEQWQGQPMEEIDEARFNQVPEEYRFMLYTTPPQPKPLTDQQIKEITLQLGWSQLSVDDCKFARAIEAAHGIKE